MQKILLAVMLFTMSIQSYASAIDTATEIQDAFANVADKAFPAVVVINVNKKIALSESQLPPQLPPWLKNFLNKKRRYYNQLRPQESKELMAKGSGVIINPEGYIVTNSHVVDNADKITVQFKDHKEYEAKLIGSDKKTDLAVLKINSDKEFPYLQFGDSDKLRVGHWAIAIGAPFDMEYTMTVGIVSQKSRQVGLNTYENYIQTDASINLGNSGGPLLNINGDVIGINDFIISPNEGNGIAGSIGLGFAIPSNMVKNVVEQLIAEGKVERPWLGISMQNLDDNMKVYMNVNSGVLVGDVVEGNPADAAGMKPGDIITKIGDYDVKTPHDIQFKVLSYKPGDKIRFTVIRDGEQISIDITAGKQSNNELKIAEDTDSSKANNEILSDFGMKITEENNKIIISKILPNGTAESTGLKPGMTIESINRKEVKTIKDVKESLKRNKNSILLHIQSGNARYFIVITK
jgi:serine protease Do